MKTPKGLGTKIYANGLGHIINMAAVHIYGKIFGKSTPEPDYKLPWDMIWSIW